MTDLRQKVRQLAAVGTAGALFLFHHAAFATCISPANAIEAENCLSGAPPTQWDITGSGDAEIQGFATDISTNKGQNISFKIDTASTNYKIEIYRLGYYQGNGARLVATISPSAALPQAQPACLNDLATGLIDCGNWAVSATWSVPANAVSGIYIAKPVTQDSGPFTSHIAFIVRDDASTSKILFQTSDTTWEAYNAYGGNSLYQGSPAGRAYMVSYNRPFTTRAATPEDWLFNGEYPMIRFLERNGYDVTYFTGVDGDRFGSQILNHKIFLSVGHDEYWSANQRAHVEAARNAGVNLAFFSGNESFWKTYLAQSTDLSATPNRTIVCYKETHDGGAITDPVNPLIWTGSWRDNRWDSRFNPSGPYPENALSGNIFMVNSGTTAIEVPAADGKMRFWRNTAAASLAPNDVLTLAADTLGYEWDEDLDNGFRPPGLVRMSTVTVNGVELLQDQGSNYATGTATHHLTLYRQNSDTSSALVFAAGTVQWAWGLDANHDRGNNPADLNMQQATVNLFADMSVQPATLQAGLLAALASTDVTPPTASIGLPHNGDTVSGSVLITGSAVDTGGGVVGGVEVSTDNGATWHPADGRESWSYAWSPASLGSATLLSRAVDDSGNFGLSSTPVSVTVATPTCPCSIFSQATSAGEANDTGSVELGVRFRSDEAGTISGIRFYKTSNNIGTHTGSLWTNAGTLLGLVTFTAESAVGWQEADFSAPIAIDANTTYVASYLAPNGHYVTGISFSSPLSNPPLHALQDGFDGSNGIYHYGNGGVFPADTFGSSNYLVDVVFQTGPATPAVVSTNLLNGASAVSIASNITATFNEAMDAATLTGANIALRDPSNALVPSTLSYNSGTRTVTIGPSSPLSFSTTYTATISTGVADLAANHLPTAKVWSFTTQALPPPPPDQGPGGPILVITTAADPLSTYYAEILRSEGLDEFLTKDISAILGNPSLLNSYDVMILASMPISTAGATMFSNWVNAGGNLIAINPDPNLATLLGISSAAGTTSEGYILINTLNAPGHGITPESMQFHGSANHWTLSGATKIAALYSNVSTDTGFAAVSVNNVGSGHAAAFAFDFARSIVETRQGNPAQAGQKLDGEIPPIRSDDLFYPSWVDFSKIQIPQADEQQRLLTNMIESMNLAKKPLPKFWYFPRDNKAVIVMTGDDHANGGSSGRFDEQISQSPAGCSVANWECVRSTSYVYPTTPYLTDAQAATYNNEGFEIGIHPGSACAVYTFDELNTDFSSVLSTFHTNFPSLPDPVTNRTHCISWPDWDSEPLVEYAHGMRMDLNYYYWPAAWIMDRPGLFTGSGLPQRFTDKNGSLIDVYQVTTQMPDESGETFPDFVNTLLDNATGPLGYYGAFAANMHTDSADSPGANAIVASAQSRSVPVVSSKQLLTWLDGRNGSSFGSINWSGNALSFTIFVGAGANGLRAMVPTSSSVGLLTGVTKGGTAVALTNQVIKGIQYAFFDGLAGNYVATYSVDTTPPLVTNVVVNTSNGNGSVTITWTTNELSDSSIAYGASQNNLNLITSDPTLVTNHSVTLTGLSPNATYFYALGSKDASNNQTTLATTSFTTPLSSLTDTLVADFSAGTPDLNTYVSKSDDGELILAPTVGTEFSGNALPSGWTSSIWTAGGGATVSGGSLVVDGAYASTTNTYGPGVALDFVATFGSDFNQHVGFSDNFNSKWIIFSTCNSASCPGALSGQLYARTNFGSENAVLIPGSFIGTPHHYRIEWNGAATEVKFFVDGTLVSTQDGSFSASLSPIASDFASGGQVLGVDWIRMSPYVPSATFTSRVFNAGSAVNWSALTWTVDLPTNTSLAMSVRTGNTPTPDGSWTTFKPIASAADTIGGNSQYLQYRAVLSSSDSSTTPTLTSVSASYSLGADTTPPTVTGRTPSPGETQVPLSTDIAVQFSEGMDASSFNATRFTLRAQGAGSDVLAILSVVGATATLHPSSPLLPNQLYNVKVSGLVSDNASNQLGTDDTWSFTTGPITQSFFDDVVVGQFDAGSSSLEGTYVSQTGNGEVILAPFLGSEFSGSSLPVGFESSTWEFAGGAPGGSATVSGGTLVVNGAYARTTATFAKGRVLEFYATFGGQHFENVGFAVDFNNDADWAAFGFGSDTSTLYARTNNAGAVTDTAISAANVNPSAPHLFRIEWDLTEVRYYVDGVIVATTAADFGTTQMRPLVSDFDSGLPGVSVDWMRMSPYSGPATFTSRVFDAGTTYDWTTLSAQVTTPLLTGITFETRTGNIQAPDGTWSAFAPVSGSTIASPSGRFLQYRATLTTTDPNITPVLGRIDISANQTPLTPQTINFTSTAPVNAVIGSTYSPTATSTSGLVVALSIDAASSSICSIVGGLVTFNAAGNCIIDANQTGDATYAPATQLQQSVAVSKDPQTINFTSTAPVNAVIGTTYSAAAASTSGLAVALSVDAASASICSIVGGLVTFNATGTCIIDANQTGNATYAPATQVQQSVAVSKDPQTINFTSTAPLNAVIGSTYSPTATSTSGLTVALTIDAASSSICSIVGGLVTFNAAGNCVIDANQTGNATYAPATQVQQSVAVSKDLQTLNFTSTAPVNAVIGNTYSPTATSTSGLTVTLTIDAASSSICGFAGGLVTFSAAGTCIIDANQTGNATYAPATQVQQSTAVSVVINTNHLPVITQPADLNAKVGDVITLQVAATDPDGNAITFSATGLPSNLTINPATGLISGTISSANLAASPLTITVFVSDGIGQSSVSFRISVSATQTTGSSVSSGCNATGSGPAQDMFPIALACAIFLIWRGNRQIRASLKRKHRV